MNTVQSYQTKEHVFMTKSKKAPTKEPFT